MLKIVKLLFAVLAVVFAVSGAGIDKAAAAAVTVVVDISSQSMSVNAGGKVYSWRVSTGRNGYRTPTGTYRPQRMHAKYHSRKYNGAPMPHAVFFRGGYAIHGTYETGKLGRPASHGCIRLAPGNAQALFSLIKKAGPRNVRIQVRA